MRAHPVRYGLLAAALVAALVVVLLWFQPQTLLFDRVVDEEFPTADDVDPAVTAAPEEADDPATDGEPVDSTDDAGDDARQGTDEDDADDDGRDDAGGDGVSEADAAPAGPQAVAAGRFESRNRYTVEGDASVHVLEDGSRVLRLEDFSSTNGPDLLVYLTAGDEADGDDVLAADYVDLGLLSGNVGNQNYDIPDDVDLDRYDTAVIWCRRFTVGFGAADLHPVEG